jgi:hypothetical protein
MGCTAAPQTLSKRKITLNNPLIQVPASVPTVAEPQFGCGCENPTLIGSIILGLFSRVLTALLVRAFTSCRSIKTKTKK